MSNVGREFLCGTANAWQADRYLTSFQEGDIGAFMIIAAREYLITEAQEEKCLRLTFFAPKQTATEWGCRYEIAGFDEMIAGGAYGEDALQALCMSMQKAAVVLYSSEPWMQSRLTWNGDRDLGLPVPKGYEPA